MTSHELHPLIHCPKDIRGLIDGDFYADAPIFMSEVTKINDHYQAQKRIIVCTSQTFYNIKRSFWGWHSVQKAFPVSTITGLIRNPHSGEFVLKLALSQPNDYRYQGDCIERFTTVLLGITPNLQVWTLRMDLDVYVRRKRDQPSSPHLVLPTSNHFA